MSSIPSRSVLDRKLEKDIFKKDNLQISTMSFLKRRLSGTEETTPQGRLHQFSQRSRVSYGLSKMHDLKEPLHSAPTFYPTLEEFEDPITYIQKIRHEGERFGICLIKPPHGWNPPLLERESSSILYPTRSQRVDLVCKGAPFPDGPVFSASAFHKMADTFKKDILQLFGESDTIESVERLFWKIAESGTEKGVEVFYANDLETGTFGSGFPNRRKEWKGVENRVEFDNPDYYERTGWNLNNLPYLEKSILRSVGDDLSGVIVPWLYIGMIFSLFAWHNEVSTRPSIVSFEGA